MFMQVLKETNSYRTELKTRVMDTALRAFMQRGIRAVKMDDISAELGISKRTLYEIFNDKEELLFQCICQYDQQQRDTLTRYAAEGYDVIEVIMQAYRLKIQEARMVSPAFYVDILKYPKLAAYIKKNNEQARENFVQFMKRGVEEGYLRADVNYEMVPHIFDAIGQYIPKSQLLQKYSVEELFSTYIMMSLRGLCTQRGLKAIDEALG